MGLSKEQLGQRAERRQRVATLYLRRVPPFVIARRLQHHYKTIKKDIAWLETQWQKELVDDPVALRRREVADLEVMEEDSAVQFQATKGREWVTARLAIKERRSKLLGLDVPAKLEHSGVDGGPIQTDMKVILDALNDPEAREALDALSQRLESQPSGDGG